MKIDKQVAAFLSSAAIDCNAVRWKKTSLIGCLATWKKTSLIGCLATWKYRIRGYGLGVNLVSERLIDHIESNHWPVDYMRGQYRRQNRLHIEIANKVF
jgi:hypothetical protein